MKRRTPWFLLALLLLMLLPQLSLAQDAGNDFSYTLGADGTATVTGYQGSEPNVVVPDTLGGARVTAIGGAAFLGNLDITSVTLPEGIQKIGNAAFKNARNLAQLNLPTALTDLGESAFENCYALQSLVVPQGISEIKDRTFQNCKALSSLTLPDTITKVGLASFSGLDSLKEFDLPRSLTTIGMGAFAVSNGLEKIVLPATVEEIGYSAFHGCQNLKSIVLSTGLKKIVGGMFYDCPNLETVAFPATIRTIDTSMIFTGSDKVKVLGFEGSDAQGLARTLRLPFEAIQPVRGMELTYHNGENAIGNMVGIDLASEVKTLQLTAKLTQDTPWPLIEWKSSQPSVAMVDQHGLVTGLKSGTAKITAMATDGNGHSVSTELNVAVLVKGISILGDSELTANKRTDLKASITPENADNRSVDWASSDEASASVNKNGRVTARKVDAIKTVQITAASKDGSGVVGTHTLTIYPVAKSIALTADGREIGAKEQVGIDFGSDKLTVQLQGSVLPQDARQEVSYRSSSPKVVEVTDTGLITALKKGTANITVTALDGTNVRASWRVNVAALVHEVQITGENSVVAGQTIQLSAAAYPETADNRQVTWTTSNPDIATVNGGKVLGNKKVNAISTVDIIATAKDGSGVQATHTVTVYPAAASINLSARGEALTAKSTLGMDINAQNPTEQLTASVSPEGAFQEVTYKSSHPRFVTVDENGLLTAIAKGEATITATAKDGSGRKLAFKVKVSVHATGLTLSSDKDLLKSRESVRLKATFSPENVDSKALIWTSSDESLATVDTRGTVEARRNLTGPGEVTITATTRDGSNIAATIVIKVEPR